MSAAPAGSGSPGINSPQQGWDVFLNRYYKKEIHAFAFEFPDTHSLNLDFGYLDRFNSEVADHLLEHPVDALGIASAALSNFALPIVKSLDGAHIRIQNLPSHSHIPIRDLRSEHIGKLIMIDGLVRMATEIRPLLLTAAFECTSCGEIIFIEQSGAMFIEPYSCRNADCVGKRFKLVLEQSTFVDFQKLRVQESPDNLRGGEQPQTLDITVEDDIVGMVSPGAHVYVVGILKSFQRVTREGKTPIFDIVLAANHVEVRDKEFSEVEITPEEEQEILELSRDPDIVNKITRSIAPSIFGYVDVKEGLAMQLMSGVPKHLPDGTRVRGDMHILMVGDPGIAKSQLLRYMVKLSPRGLYTSGRSSSAAGLTAAAIKSDIFGDGRWTLEAGALVLADQGIACIDEMDKMQPSDRSAIHEALEQQTVSIAKAGIMASLKSRCAVLGAANPKSGRFDPYEGVAQQINISAALLSRFDLIFILRDVPNMVNDAAISEHIIKAHHAGEMLAQRNDSVQPIHSAAEVEDAMGVITPEIQPELLRKYVAYARRNIHPIMDKAAREHLIQFYIKLRDQGDKRDTPVAVTARQLEALVRLCEASAKLRLDEHITFDDAERVVSVVIACLEQVAFDKETGLFDADMLSSGRSKTQRDKIRQIRDIVASLSKDSPDDSALREDVLNMAVEQDLDREYTETTIAKLLSDGELYAPSHDRIRKVV
jgi:replicative DNA helicase Mcm